jgi:hypothetical protein
LGSLFLDDGSSDVTLSGMVSLTVLIWISLWGKAMVLIQIQSVHRKFLRVPKSHDYSG